MHNHKLGPVRSSAKWLEVASRLNRPLSLNSFMVLRKGEFLVPPSPGDNRVCEHVLTNTTMAPRCQECLGLAASECVMSEAPVVRRCHMGLQVLAVPVQTEDECIGALGGCGCLNEAEPPSPRQTKELVRLANTGPLGLSGIARVSEFQLSWQTDMMLGEIQRLHRTHLRQSQILAPLPAARLDVSSQRKREIVAPPVAAPPGCAALGTNRHSKTGKLPPPSGSYPVVGLPPIREPNHTPTRVPRPESGREPTIRRPQSGTYPVMRSAGSGCHPAATGTGRVEDRGQDTPSGSRATTNVDRVVTRVPLPRPPRAVQRRRFPNP